MSEIISRIKHFLIETTELVLLFILIIGMLSWALGENAPMIRANILKAVAPHAEASTIQPEEPYKIIEIKGWFPWTKKATFTALRGFPCHGSELCDKPYLYKNVPIKDAIKILKQSQKYQNELSRNSK